MEKKYCQDEKIKLKDCGNENEDYFENMGVRKAILLTQYVNFLKSYLQGIVVNENTGIVVPSTSIQTEPVELDENAKKIWKQFIEYFQKEMEIINDDNLRKDLSVLENILKQATVENEIKENETTVQND